MRVGPPVEISSDVAGNLAAFFGDRGRVIRQIPLGLGEEINLGIQCGILWLFNDKYLPRFRSPAIPSCDGGH